MEEKPDLKRYTVSFTSDEHTMLLRLKHSLEVKHNKSLSVTEVIKQCLKETTAAEL